MLKKSRNGGSAEDPGLPSLVFETARRFVVSAPVYRLTFVPTPESGS
ncbi:MAG: hypothetical protein ABSC23_02305 [Bryobacteraceae bacterium]